MSNFHMLMAKWTFITVIVTVFWVKDSNLSITRPLLLILPPNYSSETRSSWSIYNLGLINLKNRVSLQARATVVHRGIHPIARPWWFNCDDTRTPILYRRGGFVNRYPANSRTLAHSRSARLCGWQTQDKQNAALCAGFLTRTRVYMCGELVTDREATLVRAKYTYSTYIYTHG